MLDKRSPIPLYYQLAERLRSDIAVGRLQPGDQVPSERELSQQMGISRMTTRQAIAYLEREGLLEVRPGVGVFVAAPKFTQDALHLLGFTEEMTRRGSIVASHVLEQGLTPPPPAIAARLALTEAEQTIKIVRLRLVDDLPVLLETSYLPAVLCPDLATMDLTRQSLYGVLEARYGIVLQRASQTLSVSTVNDEEQRLFAAPAGHTVIVVEGVAFDSSERPIEYFKAIYRGDRFRFALESRRNGIAVGGGGMQLVEMSVGLRS